MRAILSTKKPCHCSNKAFENPTKDGHNNSKLTLQTVLYVLDFGLSVFGWFTLFVHTDKNDLIDSDYGLAGHHISYFALERDGSGSKIGCDNSYLYDISLLGRADKINFRNVLGDAARSFQLHYGIERCFFIDPLQ